MELRVTQGQAILEQLALKGLLAQAEGKRVLRGTQVRLVLRAIQELAQRGQLGLKVLQAPRAILATKGLLDQRGTQEQVVPKD